MLNVKYLVGGAALVLATSALAGGLEQAPVAAPAVSNSGFYINANGGINLMNDASPVDTLGWNAGGALGYHFGNFRVEAASNYWRHGVRRNLIVPLNNISTSFQMVTVMGNAYYDFDFGSSLVPYIGAGLGWAHQWATASFQNVSATASKNFFAFQGIAGLDYKISDNVRVGVSYHAVDFAGKNDNNRVRLSKNIENQIVFGISYSF